MIWIVIFYEWITIYNLIHIDEWWDAVGMNLIMSLLGGSPPNGNPMAEFKRILMDFVRWRNLGLGET